MKTFKAFILAEEQAGPSGANTGSVPDPSNIGPKKRKKSVVTKHYIEIMGRRKKVKM